MNKKYKGPGIYNTDTGELLAPIEQEFYEHRGPLHVYWIRNKKDWADRTALTALTTKSSWVAKIQPE